MRRTILLLAVLTAVVVPASASATPPQGPVTILTQVNFLTDPVSGTFEVDPGDDLLGCSAGTFVDYPAWVNASGGAMAKVFTCTDGGTGGFVANFQTFLGRPGAGDGNGNWNVTSGTGAFAGLHGRGYFFVVISGDGTSGVETLTGTIHFD